MPTRKTPPPTAGPTCPACKRLVADLKQMKSQQRKQATALNKLEAQLRTQATELAKERERHHQLETALHWQSFTQPYLLHLFGQHLPEGNVLAAGLTHFN